MGWERAWVGVRVILDEVEKKSLPLPLINLRSLGSRLRYCFAWSEWNRWCPVLAVMEVLLALNWMCVNTICFYECKSNKDTDAISSKTFVNYRYL